MSLKCGIVGLPNVGKSTLFNALTKAGIAAENYPFCTIEPNVGVVELPDPRLARLAAIVRPERVIPAERPRAREHEVPEAGEAEERSGLGAKRHPETRDLREPARDQRRARVLAETDPVRQPRRHRHHVLERPRDLDPDHVAVRVEPERGTGEAALQIPRQLLVVGRDHQRRRPPERHLARERRSRQDRQRAARQTLAEEHRDPPPAARLEALGRGHHRRG